MKNTQKISWLKTTTFPIFIKFSPVLTSRISVKTSRCLFNAFISGKSIQEINATHAFSCRTFRFMGNWEENLDVSQHIKKSHEIVSGNLENQQFRTVLQGFVCPIHYWNGMSFVYFLLMCLPVRRSPFFIEKKPLYSLYTFITSESTPQHSDYMPWHKYPVSLNLHVLY